MALWVCGGEAGCGTKYAVGLFRCPRCHNTDFYEDGDPMAKITRHGGPSDKTLPVPDPEDAAAEADAAPETAADQPEATEVRGEHGPEAVGLPYGDAVVPTAADEEEGGEESSPGSSSSASTEKPQPTSEPSEPQTPSPAPTTGSRSRKGRTGSRSAPSTAGDPETGTSAADGAE